VTPHAFRSSAAPQASVPGTKMPFAGLTNAGQRADVIAYLASIAKP